MGVDYFAHAVLGVILDEEDQEALDELFDEVRERMADESDDDDLVDDVVDAMHEIKQETLAAKYGDHPEARLFRSSSEDAMTGRCATEPDTWLWGVSNWAIRETARDTGFRIPRSWDWDWHTWVSVG